MQLQGQFVVLEGPDGVGKTALSQALTKYLNEHGVDTDYLSFPGREENTLGHHVYKLHHDPASYDIKSINPSSLQIMHIAAHIDAIEGYIIPSLKAGKCIILDRFWWSTLVYGRNLGANKEVLQAALKAELLSWGNVKPLAIILLTRSFSLRPEQDVVTWNKLCATYYELAEEQKRYCTVRTINNDSTVEQTLEKVVQNLQELHGVSLVTNKNKNGKNSQESYPKGPEQLSLGFSDKNESIKQDPAPRAINHLAPLEPTKVFDTYWRFAAERQAIFFRRFESEGPPWTEDPILAQYKFTNAYRASDRVSQYLIKNVIYSGSQLPEEVFFRIILFKIFNRIETWELLIQKLGCIDYAEYNFEKYDDVLTEAMSNGETIFSAAYIMPSGGTSFGYSKKHRNFLRLLETMMKDAVPLQLSELRLMRQAFELLRSYPLMGDFLAYQYTIDINYSEITNFDEMEFVVPGPGAKDGIRKCFQSLGGLNEMDVIRIMAERQNEEFDRLKLQFRSLWGRKLQLIDCQNLFCEVDKYARIAHPDVQGISHRTRIKQSYQGTQKPIDYWYPPKWDINKLVEK